ncbi:MAG: glycosyltransferase [Firmicutes bacterium]|nr:glycosyltransferase [Bacillota bacterium]
MVYKSGVTEKQKLIVVLGMHRSGTSAITRGLQVLGVHLGDKLIPPAKDNSKGFFEDMDITLLNAEMLQALGIDWHYLSPLIQSDIEKLREKGYLLRATELLRQKLSDCPAWGLKDPRLAKLLPFWQEVFVHCGLDVSYVLALRHPLSVVKSLAKRDGFEAEKSYLLWLGHVLMSVVNTEEQKRILVDYDSLMGNPEHELERMAESLGLKMDSKALEVYKSRFLDTGLRHSKYGLNDLLLDNACPPIVLDIYTELLTIALEEKSLNDTDLHIKTVVWLKEFDRLKSIFCLVDRLAVQKTNLDWIVAERDEQILSLNQVVVESNSQIVNYQHTVAECDAQINNYQNVVAERDAQINNYQHIVSERDARISNYQNAVLEYELQVKNHRHSISEYETQINNYRHAISEHEIQVNNYQQAMSEYEVQINNYQQVVSERGEQIAQLNKLIFEQEEQIVSLRQELTALNTHIAAIYRTKSWRLMQPLRFLRQLPNKLCRLVPYRLIRGIFIVIKREFVRHGSSGFIKRLPHYLKNYRTYLALLTSRVPAADGGLFNSSPQVPRDICLHPELLDVRELIETSVSIIIPTLNAGAEFNLLLRKIKMQQGIREIEIVIVDSGSTDGTVEQARLAGCTIVQIKPEDFSHSYARNLGADTAHGDYLLFMVQDAYPIGDYWVYGMLRYLLDHDEENLVAVSCSEYSRSDSDMMYDSLIHTHYCFLGCLEYDRIGEYQSDDHMALRAQGQLSDVACLIPHEIFNRYRYRGDYAEDLDLGIRLIKDGYRVAMLASVKVIHSHRRSPYYYLKRSFVDVIFLVGMFNDFIYPPIESSLGLIAGIVSTAKHLSCWLTGFDESGSEFLLPEELRMLINEWRHSFITLKFEDEVHLGDQLLDAYIDDLFMRYVKPKQINKAALGEAGRFLDNFLSRLEHFNNTFAEHVYTRQDNILRRQLRETVIKTFAATTGSLLGFMYMDLAQAEGNELIMAETIKSELQRGI